MEKKEGNEKSPGTDIPEEKNGKLEKEYREKKRYLVRISTSWRYKNPRKTETGGSSPTMGQFPSNARFE